MSELLTWMAEQEKQIVRSNPENMDLALTDLAAQVHYLIGIIHPFGDSNGRIGRLLTNYLLAKYGFEIAEISGVEDPPILNAIRFHHERWDGKGYLKGKKECDIPLEGRLLMVADVFDALTTKRPYKVAWEPYEAVSFIVKQSKKMFDPEIVRLFLLSFGLYPVNTKVILNTDELAIVVGNRRGSITRPIVKVIRNDQQMEIDLSTDDKTSIKKVVKIRMLKD